jgi:hypothetical protein
MGRLADDDLMVGVTCDYSQEQSHVDLRAEAITFGPAPAALDTVKTALLTVRLEGADH